ncbi:uncharacterized protein MONOS_1349 [Monocercomonoides exilis]|uniref:uncharacterized protein n=1 Tax=Monocercomonoides exilis TaxID=2049356 RepID=UPI00355A181E|nr:hypothetical protein MONOS_1349 [Monocercomonoides exilis]|eukprot:MONOS_1349.1-p1 / transcript=MONOS_1349.1 / gene=MONOS_1349 / organism=Monocercomonoides_exilis_PA203 / gene_product=unspecified product / transcript_product=unspecified product / location=Mono_scaffold00023:117344-121694(+) / protein_length=1404 / sequence_SO=supercontig / SO=protein_coding / is_pseudo=false
MNLIYLIAVAVSFANCVSKKQIVHSISSFPEFGVQINPRYSPIFQYIVSDASPSLFIGGGVTYHERLLSDVFITKINPIHNDIVQIPQESQKPLVKSFAQFRIENKIYIWGGCKETGFSNTLYMFDIAVCQWSEVDQGNTIPKARHSMAYAMSENKLYIFGGICTDGLLNDVWMFDIDAKRWTEAKISENGDTPEPCKGAGMLVSNGFAIVYGGDTGAEEVPTLKIRRVKIDANVPSDWEKVKIVNVKGEESDIPNSRSNFGHATYISGGSATSYIFGGWEANSPFNVATSLLILDCTKATSDEPGEVSAKFKEIVFDHEPTKRYSLSRGDCACTTDDNGNLYIFGGRKGQYLNSDLIVVAKEDLSFEQTEASTYSQEAYERRRRFRNKMCTKSLQNDLFGYSKYLSDGDRQFSSSPSSDISHSFMGIPVTQSNSERIFDPLTAEVNAESPFQLLMKVNFFAPSARVNAIVGTFGGSLYVYGGREVETGTILSDLHFLDFETKTWTQIDFDASPNVLSEVPPARELASAVCDSGRLLIFGGRGPNPQTGIIEESSELWEFRFATMSWKKLVKSSSVHPLPVSAPSCGIYLDYFMCFSGKLADGTLSHHGYVFNFATDEWEFNINLGAAFEKGTTFVMDMVPHPHMDKFSAKKRSRFSFKETRNTQDIAEKNTTNSASEAEDNGMHKTMVILGGDSGTEPIRTFGVVDLVHELSSNAQENAHSLRNEGNERTYWNNIMKHSHEKQHTKVFAGHDKTARNNNDTNALYERSQKNFRKAANDDPVQSIFNFKDGLSIPMDTRALMLGGQLRGAAQDLFRMVTFDSEANVEVTDDDGSALGGDSHIDLVESSCTYFQRKVICFGGRRIGKGRAVLPQAHDNVYIFSLNKDVVPCSPGTYENENGECVDCPIGSYTDEFGSKACNKCPPGTVGEMKGSKRDSCLPVLQGRYTDTAGADKMLNCTAEQFCPIGSATTDNVVPKADGKKTSQPEAFEAPVKKENYLMLGLYLGFALIGVVVSVILLLCPTRSYLYVVDTYSDEYCNSYDLATHSGTKLVRKTTCGGILSIVGIFFVVGASLLVIISFAIFNTVETKSIVDVSMESEADLETFKNKNIHVEIMLMDYTGECVGAPQNTTQELSGKCSEKLGIGKTQFDPFDHYPSLKFPNAPKCTQKPSTNLYYMPTHHCTIVLDSSNDNYSIVNSIVQFFAMHSREKDASARAIQVYASVDTAVPVQHNLKFGPDTFSSSVESIFVSDADRILKGSSNSNITLDLIQSIYRNEKSSTPEIAKGHLLNYIQFSVGSNPDYVEQLKEIGFGVNVHLQLGKTVALTRHSMKMTWVMLLTSLGGTFVYLRYFGNILPILEIFLSFNWPCGKKLQRSLSNAVNTSSKNQSAESIALLDSKPKENDA